MAYIYRTGFEFGKIEYGMSETVPIGALGFVTSPINSGVYAYRTGYCTSGSWTYGLKISYGSSLSELYGQVAMRWGNNWNSNKHLFGFYNGSTRLCELWYNVSTGLLTFSVGGSIKATTTMFAEWTWFMLEFYLKVDSSGRFILKVNGTSVIDWSGDTRNGQSVTDRIFFPCSPASDVNDGFYIDDFVICDTNSPAPISWLGGIKHALGYVITDDGPNEFIQVGSGSNHYEVVDERPPSSLDYLYTETDSQEERFTISDLDEDEISSIEYVALYAWGFRGPSDVEPCVIKLGLELAGGDHLGDALDPGTLLRNVIQPFNTNPETSAKFTFSEIQNAKLIVEAT